MGEKNKGIYLVMVGFFSLSLAFSRFVIGFVIFSYLNNLSPKKIHVKAFVAYFIINKRKSVFNTNLITHTYKQKQTSDGVFFNSFFSSSAAKYSIS
jgi:hypothetical protein